MKSIVTAAVISTVMLAVSGSAMAETQWQKDHPRRAEVNSRINNQNAKTHNEVANGKLTPAQGAQLHKEDHQIRQEERTMAAQHGGHITKQDQRILNRQENQVNAQRRAEIRGNQ
ncbi:MAG: hypothetical protein JWN73_510 [Betaproteobacteria bacterium]|nr:hypothetical protein [Betaproteobacteria bacterium]